MTAMKERSQSVWMDVEVAPEAEPLSQDTDVEIVVVGSGIAGLSIAYELAEKGVSVLVIDRGEIAGGMTSRTTAHLAPICDDSLAELVSKRGRDAARAFQASQAAAVDRIESIVARHEIDCEFRRLDGILFLAPTDEETVLDDEVKAAAHIAVDVMRGSGLPLQGLHATPYLRYPEQATFHPLKYLRALCDVISAKGGRLHPRSAVEEIEETEDGVTVRAANGISVTARHAVVATNSPIHARYAYHTKQAPYRTYAMAFEIERGLVNDALYWDTLDPYHYVRLTGGSDGNDLLIVGGEDHKTGEDDNAVERFAALETWVKTLVPKLGRETHRWSGQVMDTLDFGAYIGLDADSKRVYVTTGDSGQGITHGVVASLIIPKLIADEQSEYAAIYDPSRTPAKRFGAFVGENLTAVSNLAQYVMPSEITSVDELKQGEGAILRDGLSKIAAYRADSGEVVKVSAVCTHLGCHVKWNSFEQCWDCPCHGSHFAPDGTVLNGPAVKPLPPA
ncbi:FAD-dependent oxidoreductase [Bosea sp. BK604]|uniref:FAD-dependent oxidoreductase n=1 Tax=Bosea sp. BK604 TaxID=2512180 RepID=UPI00104DDC28|nr:FAD-dependent oxidoreductase [Bosea sp. BK604]TCR68256.1 glycine/D-amino acid oxidase-like deaminating enzyme [Bosea sp. BK604]